MSHTYGELQRDVAQGLLAPGRRTDVPAQGGSAAAVPWVHEVDRVTAARDELRRTEDRGAPEPDEELRQTQSPGPGSGAPPAVKAPPAKPPTLSATFSISGNTYTDTATESRKKVQFDAAWTGGKQEDYVIVNWVKGYIKNAAGKPLKAQLYGKATDVDFADWQVDSVDADPVYWSDSTARWNYTAPSAGKFFATDNPGPMKDSDGKGAEAKVDFKTAVYKDADVAKTTTGSLAATPLTSFETWDYHVLVEGGGKFSHPK